MAVISCPECGGTLSTRASACPHCGFVIDDEESRTMVKKKQLDQAMEYIALKNQCVISTYKQTRKQLIIRIITFLIPALFFAIITIKEYNGDEYEHYVDDYFLFLLPLSLLISFFATMLLKDGIFQAIGKLIGMAVGAALNIIFLALIALVAIFLISFLAKKLLTINQDLIAVILAIIMGTPDLIMFIKELYNLHRNKPDYKNAKSNPITNAVIVSDETINKYLGSSEDEYVDD